MIGDHNNEIAHLRRLIRFVEATPEEGVRMMLDQLRGQVYRITASADRYKLKEQKKRVSDTRRRAVQTHATRRT